MSAPSDTRTGPVVEIRGLSKNYGATQALRALTLTIPSGAVGLLGPNGAGKTTLIKLLLGLLAPDTGEAHIAGFDPRTRAGRIGLRRAVGYMPESDCLIPELNAVDLVATLGELSGLSRSDAMMRAHETLDYVGLDEARYRQCNEYSTGMKQRLKLAQALVHDPELLLLDEPTNGLDPKGRKHMLELVHDLGHVQKKSVLMCSHLLPDVERTCTDVIVLDKGSVVLSGGIADLTANRGQRVRLEFGVPAPALAEELARSGFVVAKQDERSLELVLPETERDGDRVFAAVARAGVPLRAYTPLRSSLEDVFLEGLSQHEAHP